MKRLPTKAIIECDDGEQRVQFEVQVHQIDIQYHGSPYNYGLQTLTVSGALLCERVVGKKDPTVALLRELAQVDPCPACDQRPCADGCALTQRLKELQRG